jgi:hypothetical protein
MFTKEEIHQDILSILYDLVEDSSLNYQSKESVKEIIDSIFYKALSTLN